MVKSRFHGSALVHQTLFGVCVEYIWLICVISHRRAIEVVSKALSLDWVDHKHADCRKTSIITCPFISNYYPLKMIN